MRKMMVRVRLLAFDPVAPLRAAVLGLLAVMLAGSVMAATASAGPGPFWYHREVGAKGNGVKISANAPESFKGTGGTQTLKSIVSGTPIVTRASSVQVKGAILNNVFQGQIKLELIYNQPALVEPALKECTVRIGTDNIVVVKGHLAWKWNGEKKQLEEQKQKEAGQTPILLSTPREIQQGATALPEGVVTTLTLTGSGCGVLAGAHTIEGNEVGLPSPAGLEEFSRTLVVRTLEEAVGQRYKLHFWNGLKFIGAEANLALASNSFFLIGQTAVESAKQEVAILES
jgi:hypothetical protein